MNFEPVSRRHKRIARAFDAAAKTYDSATRLQADVAARLIARISDFPPDRAPRAILDLGCGSGHVCALARARWPRARIAALDLAPAMLEQVARKNLGVETILADAADPPRGRRYDLVLSSMMLHWLHEPRAALEKWRALLAPGGRLRVALPVAGSLDEWRRLCAQAGFEARLWPFPDGEFAKGLAQAEMEMFSSTFASAREFAAQMKQIGAQSGDEHRAPASPAALRRAFKAAPGPFHARYKIAFLDAQ